MAVFTFFPPRLAQPAQPQLGEGQRLRGLEQDVLALAFRLQERGCRVEPRQRRRLVVAAADARGHHGVGGGGGGGDRQGAGGERQLLFGKI